GVYPVHLAAMLMHDVEEIRAVGTLTPLGVDEQECVTLRNASGTVASLTACMSATTPTIASIAGTEARLDLAGPFYQPTSIQLVDPDGRTLDTWEPEVSDAHLGLRFEAAELARCVAEGRRESALLPWSETRRVMALMDDARAQLGVVLPGE